METDLILGAFVGVVIVSALIVVVLVALKRSGNRRARELYQRTDTRAGMRRAATPESNSKYRRNEKPTKMRRQDAQDNIKEYNKEMPSASEGKVTGRVDIAPSFGRTDQPDSIESSESEEKRQGKNDSPPAAGGEDGSALTGKTNDEFEKQAARNEHGDLTSLFTDTLMEESRESKFAKSLNNIDIQDLLTQIKTLVQTSKKND